MNFVWMMLAFLIFSGVVLFFCDTLKVNMGEGLILSSSCIVLVLFLSSLAAGTFTCGMYVIFFLAAVGGILWCVGKSGLPAVLGRLPARAEREESAGAGISPAYLLLLALYVGWLVLLYHDFIQHIDELHQWAAAVRYMLEKDKMPTGYDFIGGGGQYGFATSLFHLFFQKISGYNEQNMYISSMMLSWIGFLLPFSGYGRKEWKKVVLYAAIVYIGLFTLYIYGPKSIYVDVPTAAWAGGLAGWWTERRKKKTDYLVACSGLVMLHFFKQSAGLLMAVLALIFMIVHTLVVENGYLYNKKNGMKRLTVLSVCTWGLVFAGSLVLYAVAVNLHAEGGHWAIAGISMPDGLGNMFTYVQLSGEKAFKILNVYMTKLLGEPMASKSSLRIPVVPFVLSVLILLEACGDLFNKKQEYTVYIYYVVFASLSYFAALYFSYVFMFASELGTDLRSVRRYFSIYALFLFVFLLTVLLQKKQARNEYIRKYLASGILLFFALGLNNSFLPNATAVDKENISSYSKIEKTVSQISQLNGILGEDDKVYYICQYTGNLSGAELYNATALYYLEDQISNYLAFPWRFTPEGSNIRIENSDITIEALPDLLAQNGFTYLWIFKNDNYLAEELPKVLRCGEVRKKSLYRIIYEDGKAVGLEHVQEL